LFLAELKRRRVTRSAVLYIAGGIALVEGAGAIQRTFGFSQAAYNLIVVLVSVGLPAILVLAWFVEITPEGIRRTEGCPLTRLPTSCRPHGA
jgi:hypothetical protein